MIRNAKSHLLKRLHTTTIARSNVSDIEILPLSEVSDKLGPTKPAINETSQLIQQFIIHKPGESTLPDEKKESLPSNEPLDNLYHNWNLDPNQFLPLFNPNKPSPYTFHSTQNADPSYLKSPRLAVTKLLVDSWCELRDYYKIYAGSPAFVPTRATILGSKRHAELEHELHPEYDNTDLYKAIDLLYEEASRTSDVLQESVYGNADGSELGIEWSEKIISRFYQLITTSEAREVLAHCFIDLKEKTYLESTAQLLSKSGPEPNHSKVLVSGIIDRLRLVNNSDPENLSLFEEIQVSNEYSFKRAINNRQIIDLPEFISRISPIIKDHANAFKLAISDIKTRSYNVIPAQQSVLDSAKLQTGYYRKMMSLLANESGANPNFAYDSLLQNAITRGIDIDKPINFKSMITILRQNYHIFYEDFVKLANGTPLGFEPYDSWLSIQSFTPYDVSALINEKVQTSQEADDVLSTLSTEENFDYSELLTPELVGEWKVPLTLRYFAARSAQMYQLFANILGNTTSVEYHNVKTGNCFHKAEYQYDPSELDRHLVNTASFWNGDRLPIHTDDLSKCKHCDFKSRCAVPNEETDVISDRALIGAKVHQFLHYDSSDKM